MIFNSLQFALQENHTDHFRMFINTFLLQFNHKSYTTQSFTDSFITYLTQIHHPSFSSLSSFITSWLQQPGFPLITVFPSYTRSHMIQSVSFAQKQCILHSNIHVPSHFAISLTLKLIRTDSNEQTLSVSFNHPTKTITLPPNVTSFVIHLSPYLPAVIRQLSTVSLHQMDSEAIVRELRSRFFLLKNGEGSVQEVELHRHFHL